MPRRSAQSQPSQTRRADPPQGPTHDHLADRRRLRRARRTDRRRSRHRPPSTWSCRPWPAHSRSPPTTPSSGSSDQRVAGGPALPRSCCPASASDRRSPPGYRQRRAPASPQPSTSSPTPGLTPTRKQSGTSIHGEHSLRGVNRQFKRAMFLSAFALHHTASRGYATAAGTAARPTHKSSSAGPAKDTKAPRSTRGGRRAADRFRPPLSRPTRKYHHIRPTLPSEGRPRGLLCNMSPSILFPVMSPTPGVHGRVE